MLVDVVYATMKNRKNERRDEIVETRLRKVERAAFVVRRKR